MPARLLALPCGLLAALALMLPLATPLRAQVPGAESGAREEMWRAPSEEDWAKPVLVTWQRSWEDAVAVSEQTGRAILACVNMDGEIASEHYAGVRYRQPEVAEIFEPYVCVIASVYRHTPRDFDENGQRVECPRFGGVTCGEHIRMEPTLYEQFLDQTRVAPRHIMVELDGSETYDVYYAMNTRSVFQRVVDGIAEREIVPEPERTDLTLSEKVVSPDARYRVEVERAYVRGDKQQKRQILNAAAAAPSQAPPDLLRLAVFGIDVELAQLARQTLAQSEAPASVDLIATALGRPLPPAERGALVDALTRLGETSSEARDLATVHAAFEGDSGGTLDVERWSEALGGAGASYAVAAEAAQREQRIDSQEAVIESGTAEELLELAESFLSLASEQGEQEAEFARFLFLDAQAAAQTAAERGAQGWRLETALAATAYYLGDTPAALRHATAAVESGIPPQAQGWHTMVALALFAQSRQEQIREAYRNREDWPREWLADLDAACAILLQHPYGTAEQAIAYHDFLRALRVDLRAWDVALRAGERFPESAEVHARLRRGLLTDRGFEALEPFYAGWLERDDAPPAVRWYAAYASQTVAEFHRRAGALALAEEAYGRALDHYEADARQLGGDDEATLHQMVLVRSGLARLALEREELERSVNQLVAAVALRPDSLTQQDGLNLTAMDTARVLIAALREAGRDDLLETLQGSLADLDASMFELPAYERDTPIGPKDF